MISRALYVSVLLLLLSACGTMQKPVPPVLEKADLAGVSNFTRLTRSSGFGGSLVGFGGSTTPAALAELRAQGFATVINLRAAAERGAEIDASRAAAEAAGMNFVHLPFNPADSTPTIADQFIAAAGAAANQPVYIHCSSATRVAALWMVARVEVDGFSREAAAGEAGQIAGRPEGAIALGTRLLDERQP